MTLTAIYRPFSELTSPFYINTIFEPTEKKNTTIEWDDGEKANSNLILTEIFPSVHETCYLKVSTFKVSPQLYAKYVNLR